MHARLVVSSSLIALVSLIGSAAAQAPSESPAPATNPPPPIARPGAPLSPAVSQIGGQLVKVGEHNDYYYDFKRFNISTNPVGWMLGFYGVSAAYGVTDHIALRGDVNIYSDIFDNDEGGTEFGVGASLYLRRTYQGPFLEPGAIIRQIGDRSTIGPQVLVGWHWTWDSGFNMAVAAGFGRNLDADESDGFHDDDPEIFGNGYLRFGYAF